MITDTLDGRVKLAYANGLSDEQISKQEDVSISVVEDILFTCRLPIRISGVVVENDKFASVRIRMVKKGDQDV